MKKILLGALAIITVCCLVSCGEDKGKTQENNTSIVENQENTQIEPAQIPKEEQIGTAGSNIPLKDNLDGAKTKISEALVNYFEKTYGDDLDDMRFNVTKVYTVEEEQEVPALKEMNLGANEVAFEVNYELRLADGVDGMQFTASSGVYDEESRWVTEKYNVGILRPVENSDGQYEITDFGTGF